MRDTGVEPVHLSIREPKSRVSANFTNRARNNPGKFPFPVKPFKIQSISALQPLLPYPIFLFLYIFAMLVGGFAVLAVQKAIVTFSKKSGNPNEDKA